MPPEVTGDGRLARARERFLTAEPVAPGQVREAILASWRRSREWHVAADRIDLSYVRDPDLDTPLARTVAVSTRFGPTFYFDLAPGGWSSAAGVLL